MRMLSKLPTETLKLPFGKFAKPYTLK